MTKTEVIHLFLALLAGVMLGAVYFGMLYYTVRLVVRSSSPRLLLTVSFVVRLLVVLGAFYALIDWGVAAMLAGLGGFVVARFLWMWLRYGRGGPAVGAATREPKEKETDLKG
jgi:F1F0 ATPase subunit 2